MLTTAPLFCLEMHNGHESRLLLHDWQWMYTLPTHHIPLVLIRVRRSNGCSKHKALLDNGTVVLIVTPCSDSVHNQVALYGRFLHRRRHSDFRLSTLNRASFHPPPVSSGKTFSLSVPPFPH